MCNCDKNKAGVNDVWSDTIKKVQDYGTNAANDIANSAVPPIKEACRQGAIIGIKQYAIPITAGIAVTLSVTAYVGFLLGKHWKKKAKKTA